MLQVGLLITKRNRLLSVAAILDVFETVNKFYSKSGDEQPFYITLLHPANSSHNNIELLIGYPSESIQTTNKRI